MLLIDLTDADGVGKGVTLPDNVAGTPSVCCGMDSRYTAGSGKFPEL